ncbi:hypothetical protein FOCG_18440 [Fusarium oxysporum f. sp. radicis-lycopersici 26381]|uniref:Uncharacterized protein n=1 Tax=Fusarium oxysporum NRRL 32931 TaxID=660029 RepID=W9HCP3_FUSOX|nr:hypothetical protein FOYG_16931 [Fusarium oxysporum NRRL 32931]EXL38930.1 hypothetical protein FOCG_18440 [Fusarium oxysporum f. sp. radicis-lycopersici 26381]
MAEIDMSRSEIRVYQARFAGGAGSPDRPSRQTTSLTKANGP